MYSSTKKTMDMIVDSHDKYKMDAFGDICVKAIDKLQESNPMMYKDIQYQMHKLAYGDHLSEDQAKCWVDYMTNKDGTTGGHWTYEQTESVRHQYMPNANPYDFYATMNMLYSDYYNPKFDVSMYVEMAKDWLDDKDGKPCKTLLYYMFVVK